MGIVDEDIAKVRAATDFVALAGEHVALRRVGRRWIGLCPFHAEKSPSFWLNAEEGLYYCFGCRASGDAITLRPRDRPPRLRRGGRVPGRPGRRSPCATTTAPAGGTISAGPGCTTPWPGRSPGTTSGCSTAPDAAAARAYLRAERGYDGDLVRRYQLGWAPDGWDTLVRALKLPATALVRRRAWPTSTTGAATTTPSAAGSCSRSSSRAAGRSALGGRILPGGPRAQVQEHRQDRRLRQEPRPLRPELGQEGGRRRRRGGRLRGLHRRHRHAPGRRAPRPWPPAAPPWPTATSASSPTSPGASCWPTTPTSAGQAAAERSTSGSSASRSTSAVAALPPGADPGDLARRDPDASAPRRRRGPALPGLPPRPAPEPGRPRHGRGPGPGRGRRRRPGRRAPQRPGPRPVPDGGGRPVPDRPRAPAAGGGGPRRLRASRPGAGARRPPGSDRAAAELDAAALTGRPRARAGGPAASPCTAPRTVAHRLEACLFDRRLHRAAFAALWPRPTLHDAIADGRPPGGRPAAPPGGGGQRRGRRRRHGPPARAGRGPGDGELWPTSARRPDAAGGPRACRG